MIKTITIVSLSSGVLGEDFVKHELDIGVKRLEDFGLKVKFAPHALKGIEYVNDHPDKRAEDLLTALQDPETDRIMTAIGGDDTYRLLSYLLDNDELKNAPRDKIFLGFSDTTINHLMLHRAGMRTFYGQAFLSDICELDRDMLPYTKAYFQELITTGQISCTVPSELWYEGRSDFGAARIGTVPVSHPNGGFELLQGSGRFSGRILGGCIDSMFDIFDPGRYGDMPALCAKYGLFPTAEEWRGRILLLESSEEKMPPEKYERALKALKDAGVFGAVSGVLVGKPMDECHDAEYKKLLREVVDEPNLPIVCNLNVGHAMPRCIIPFGVWAEVDVGRQVISYDFSR
ncbi:MAG: LD-carboxypeptidase [Oscillospiraceae bacterium]|nr:LD-carboxypeptidase [Oscillospiraceae bacterium]